MRRNSDRIRRTSRRSWGFPEQSTRQRERAARYKNTTVAGHVTHGLKSSKERARDAQA